MKLDQFKGFGHSTGMGSKPAILVIDFMKGFTNEDSPLGFNFDNEIKATKKLLHFARQEEIPIIFTTVMYEAHFKDGAHFVQKVPALTCLTMESEWVKIDQRLERKESEPLVIKKFASAFFGTNLASILAFEKIDTTLIVGCTTSGCVRATAVDALQHGFRVVIPEECVGDRSQKAHEANLYDIETKYGDVISLETAKNYLLNLKGEK
ncbi:isochorismatase family protein [Lysinibacillus yapensis]|uniref:Isochorismatase family protein n=1 Tax=Ureibacillus yapensis TaxID=2304605 RepID=A0A396SGV7_9BACL|nr:isochorismatase family protein [Lysinibacillus yapensis]RHW38307.1 isochorismatase family protein [Lysinibacillus yapensis]